tara:strand:- start:30 stop:248 length:219 start_codon:yes stop_codon:yes gene_type:complete
MLDQDIIEGFAAEMNTQGFQVMKCPECLGAIWVEGDIDPETGENTNLKLMRYSTKSECQKCSDLHDQVCVQE